MRAFRALIYPDGRVERVGVDTGKTTLAAISYATGLVAFKVAGHTCWVSGFNPRQYVPAHYSVYKFKPIRELDGVREIEMDDLFGDLEWQTRQKLTDHYGRRKKT